MSEENKNILDAIFNEEEIVSVSQEIIDIINMDENKFHDIYGILDKKYILTIKSNRISEAIKKL